MADPPAQRRTFDTPRVLSYDFKVRAGWNFDMSCSGRASHTMPKEPWSARRVRPMDPRRTVTNRLGPGAIEATGDAEETAGAS